MNVLGFDPSLARTGWAAVDYDTGQLVDCGVIATNPGDHVLERLEHLEVGVLHVVRRFDRADVGIEEGVSHRSGLVTRRLAMAWATVALTCWRRLAVHPHEVSIGTVKRAATGHGNADKATVTAAAVTKWGTRCDDPDIADAAWIAHITRAHLLDTFNDGNDL